MSAAPARSRPLRNKQRALRVGIGGEDSRCDKRVHKQDLSVESFYYYADQGKALDDFSASRLGRKLFNPNQPV